MFSNVYTSIEQRNKINNENGYLMKVKPVVDVYETPHAVIILAEMPKVEKKDLRINIEKGVLQIQGKRENNLVEGDYLLRETADVMYERFFELEDNLDQETIEASYSAGILKITIAKKEQAKPRRIEIQ
jgi:HSP20 family protein